jgi:hypothetical protein
MSTKIGGLSQQRLRIVIGGYLGLLPGGGITWDYLQYPLGFAELGHDVYYIEDTGQWPVFQKNGDGSDCTANVRHLASVMGAFGFQGRWAYRDAPTDQWFGLSAARVEELCRSADVFLNISYSTVLRDEYREIPVRILLDSDPMFTQIQNPERFAKAAEWHSDFVTFGEHIGQPDCRIPTRGLPWRASRSACSTGLSAVIAAAATRP